MTEAALWSVMRKGLSPYGVFQRVENTVGTGTPDVAWAAWGASGWFELKSVSRGNRIKLRPRQARWIKDWFDCGGRVHIVVLWKNRLTIYSGAVALELYQKEVLDEVASVATFSWPIHSWLAVLNVLRRSGCNAAAMVSEQRPPRLQGE